MTENNNQTLEYTPLTNDEHTFIHEYVNLCIDDLDKRIDNLKNPLEVDSFEGKYEQPSHEEIMKMITHLKSLNRENRNTFITNIRQNLLFNPNSHDERFYTFTEEDRDKKITELKLRQEKYQSLKSNPAYIPHVKKLYQKYLQTPNE